MRRSSLRAPRARGAGRAREARRTFGAGPELGAGPAPEAGRAGEGVWALLLGRGLVVVLLAACWLPALAGRAGADGGPWSWPLPGAREVSRPFAPPATTYGRGHRGADLPAEPGAAVHAAGGGRVSYAGRLAGRGVVVVVHGALRTTYEPVTASVAVGALVEAGERIGQLEAAHEGCPVEACLHWGLRRGEDYLDPVRLVERGPVRLLPVGEGGPPAVASGPAAGSGQAAGSDPPARSGPAKSGAAAGSGATAGSEAAAGDAAASEIAAPPEPEPRPPAPARTAEPAWSLRAAEAPLGAAAVAALVAGIGLLARPRPSPDDPPTTAGPAAVPAPVAEADADGPVADVLELSPQRMRRRSG